MGMETCCTLGLLNAEQAKQLKDAGLTATLQHRHNWAPPVMGDPYEGTTINR